MLALTFVFGLTGPDPIIAEAAGPAIVDLGSSGNYIVLSKTAITTTGTTAITGDIGISPALSTDTSGFGLVLDVTECFSTTVPVTLITGKVYAADYSTLGCTTPAILTTAVSAMEAAYTDASTRTPGTGATNLNVGGGTLSGLNFVPGTYTWNTPGDVTITGDITITGSASDIWIFQITGTLGIEAGKKIILAGGALPENIFWQVAGTTTLKPGSIFNGIILAGPGASTIAMQGGATLHGRALGQTDVTLDANIIDTISPPPPSENIAPIANAGSDQAVTLPTDSVTLDGSVSTDSDGTIISYVWSFVSGPSDIDPTDVVSPATSGLVMGTYVFSLTVTDNNGATGVDTVSIVVNPISTSGGGGGGRPPIITPQPQPQSQVFGVATSCGIYVDKFLRKGYDNDTEAVRKVQQFLNDYTKTSLIVNGIYESETEAAVAAFQLSHKDKILTPWDKTTGRVTAPTGIFYLTTQAEVNRIMCPDMSLPIPTNLINWSQSHGYDVPLKQRN